MENTSKDEAASEVARLAKERWDLMAAGQAEKAYNYLSPASRAAIPLAAYRKRNGASRWWRSTTLEKVDCRADTCRVTMLLEYDLGDIRGLKKNIEETWVKDAGNWWLVAEK